VSKNICSLYTEHDALRVPLQYVTRFGGWNFLGANNVRQPDIKKY